MKIKNKRDEIVLKEFKTFKMFLLEIRRHLL